MSDQQNVDIAELTEAEKDALACRCHEALCPLHSEASDGYIEHEVSDLLAIVERLLAARLAPLDALADEWRADLDSGRILNGDARYAWDLAERELRAALSLSSATDEP